MSFPKISGKNCNGQHVTIYYPGDVDLAVDQHFDNQIASYTCSLLEDGY